jgi:hypothetical protein
MAVLIKNIILYEPTGSVAGFIEIRLRNGKTNLRLKQSFADKNLMLSLTAGGENKIFKIEGNFAEWTIEDELDLTYEVFVCIVRQTGKKVNSIASGGINLNKLKLKAVAEIDEAIRKVCSVDDRGHGNCEQCPYRDYFFSKGA